MERMRLDELKMGSRNEVLRFLKKLWNGEQTPCPICGNPLEPLHKGAKKNGCDWQCRTCDKTCKTLCLLDELNERMPD